MITLALERQGYRLGESVKGDLRWQAVQVDAVELRLFWFTRGKGDTDFHTVHSERLSNPGVSGSHHFSFNLPESPYSFSGKLISLVWAIEAIISPGDETERCEFILSPNGKEVVLT